MTLEEALQHVKEGKTVRRPHSLSTWVHIYPQWEFTLRPEDRLADDWEIAPEP
jgi:hypothetical protein